MSEQNKEIATVTPSELMTKYGLKNALLAQAAEDISRISADIASRSYELARILGNVQSKELYKDDGFKSAAEFAENKFGIKKGTAHMLARVGIKFLNTSNETVKKLGEQISPSNLAEITMLTDEEIEKAVADGTISPAQTQEALRGTAKAIKESRNNGGVKVLKRFDISGLAHFNGTGIPEKIEWSGVTKEDISGLFADNLAYANDGKLLSVVFDKGFPAEHEFSVYVDTYGNCAVFTMTKHEDAKAGKPAAAKDIDAMSIDELTAYIAARKAALTTKTDK